jgi:peptidoglycan hydrolase-like protein with peptidoglycan-binding domain
MRWVQTMLNQVLNLQLPVDGISSVQTRSAIRSFQEKNGLPVTGVVGPDTERALMAAGRGQSPAASPAQADEPSATPPEPGASAPVEPTTSPPPAAEFGFEWETGVNRSSPDYVKWIQQSLNRIMGLRLVEDGIIGAQTRSAIRSFQQKYGLAVDGIVGAQTERALIDAGANVEGTPAPSTVQGPKCEVAAYDLETLQDYLRWLANELSKPAPDPRRLGNLRELVRIQVDSIIANLDHYIAAGCCEPSLKTLEAQVNILPWPADSTAQAQRVRLIQAIKQAQENARRDFQHC